MTSNSSENPPEMRMVAVPRKHLASRLDELETRLDELGPQVDRGVKQRKWIFLAIAGLSLGGLLVLGLIVSMLVSRGEARRYYNDQLQRIICSVPPGDSLGDRLRLEAKCGSYSVPKGSRSPAALAPRTPAATRTVTGEARLAPPSSVNTVTVRVRQPQQTSKPRQPHRTVEQPRPTPAAPPLGSTATPTATQPTRGVLPSLVCTLLGCHP